MIFLFLIKIHFPKGVSISEILSKQLVAAEVAGAVAAQLCTN